MKSVAGHDRDGEQDERDDADYVRRQQMLDGKEKAGGAGENGGQQEDRGPAVETFAGEESIDDDDAGRDADQADDHVDESEG